MPRRRSLAMTAIALALTLATSGTASAAGYLTPQGPYVTLQAGAPPGSSLLPIINSGDTVNGFLFEGIPDGIGLRPGGPGVVQAFVNHEQSRVPFQNEADFKWSTVSKLNLDQASGGVLDGHVAIPSNQHFARFCSASMAGPAQGLSRYTFFTNEETNDILSVPPGAVYGPDPALSPNRQAGYSVLLDTDTGDYDVVPSAGRMNHENTVLVPGGWGDLVSLTGDDTFTAPASQLYMLRSENEAQLFADGGRLWAFQVTATDAGPVDPSDPFNGANDYGDITTGDDWQGRFIAVPDKIAEGTTGVAPQTALENWSNAHNVFQFIRVEDITYDKTDPHVVYFADTGERRALPDPTTGRLRRGSSTDMGPYPNGRVFRMELNAANPRFVDSFSILVDADAGGYNNPDVIHQPDNVDTSANSLMVQEDSSQPPNSRVWRYDFATQTWSVVASVNDPDWESSGIVDASAFFGPGAWLLDVQAHRDFVKTAQSGSVLIKREAGQLILMRLPGT